MNQTDISTHYKTLNLSENASNEEVSSAFKKLAFKYHPDKNRERIEWATAEMARINIAYSSIVSHRFTFPDKNRETVYAEKTGSEKKQEFYREREHNRKKYDHPDLLIDRFTKIRESVNDALYKFFQYNLNNLMRRDAVSNTAIYNDIVKVLRKNFHQIKTMKERTDDKEILEHLEIFSELIFNFYRAAECLNVIDSYKNSSDVDAYRMYKSGDDILHASQKEIFFDRHNRGKFRHEFALTGLVKAERIFEKALFSYPESSWKIETSIKKEYNMSLIKYVNLFFSE